MASRMRQASAGVSTRTRVPGISGCDQPGSTRAGPAQLGDGLKPAEVFIEAVAPSATEAGAVPPGYISDSGDTTRDNASTPRTKTSDTAETPRKGHHARPDEASTPGVGSRPRTSSTSVTCPHRHRLPHRRPDHRRLQLRLRRRLVRRRTQDGQGHRRTGRHGRPRHPRAGRAAAGRHRRRPARSGSGMTTTSP